jgi:hypothetical protein
MVFFVVLEVFIFIKTKIKVEGRIVLVFKQNYLFNLEDER